MLLGGCGEMDTARQVQIQGETVFHIVLLPLGKDTNLIILHPWVNSWADLVL